METLRIIALIENTKIKIHLTFMIKLSQNSLDSIIKLKNGCSALVHGNPNSGRSSIVIDVVSRIIKENIQYNAFFVSKNDDFDTKIELFSKSYKNEKNEELTEEDFFDRVFIQKFNQNSYFESLLAELDILYEKNQFNVLVIDDFCSFFDVRNHSYSDVICASLLWAKEKNILLFIIDQTEYVNKNDDPYFTARFDLIIEANCNNNNIYITKAIGLKSPTRFFLKVNKETNNFFEDYFIGDFRREIFKRKMYLKDFSHRNDFSYNPEETNKISNMSFDDYYTSEIKYSSKKLKNEMKNAIFLDDCFIDLDPISYIIFCRKIYGDFDLNYLREFMLKKAKKNIISINLFDDQVFNILQDFLYRMNINIKKFTKILINLNHYDISYLVQLADVISFILTKEKEVSIDFFDSSTKIKSMQQLFDSINSANLKLKDYLMIIKKEEFEENQSLISSISDINFSGFNLKIIDSVNNLYQTSDTLYNCLYNIRFVDYVATSKNYLLKVYKDEELIGAVQINNYFEIIEMRQKFNSDFSYEDQKTIKSIIDYYKLLNK